MCPEHLLPPHTPINPPPPAPSTKPQCYCHQGAYRWGGGGGGGYHYSFIHSFTHSFCGGLCPRLGKSARVQYIQWLTLPYLVPVQLGVLGVCGHYIHQQRSWLASAIAWLLQCCCCRRCHCPHRGCGCGYCRCRSGCPCRSCLPCCCRCHWNCRWCYHCRSVVVAVR